MIELLLLLYLAYAASPGLTCQTPPCASLFLPFRRGEVGEVFDVFALAAFDAVCTVIALASFWLSRIAALENAVVGSVQP